MVIDRVGVEWYRRGQGLCQRSHVEVVERVAAIMCLRIRRTLDSVSHHPNHPLKHQAPCKTRHTVLPRS